MANPTEWKKTLKPRYRALYMVVDAIVARHDPIGLLAIGCPDDEYEPEVTDLLPRLKGAASTDELMSLVHGVFERWFGERACGPKEGYRALAQDLWDCMPRWMC
jgi:hypothetical protein